jgi:hypothetical protein
MMGQWALVRRRLAAQHQGRIARRGRPSARPTRPAEQPGVPALQPEQDFNQSDDLAAQHPQKVKEMRAQFLAEAKKYQVFPLDASVAARIVAPRPNITAGRSEFVYTRPMVGLPQGDSPFC